MLETRALSGEPEESVDTVFREFPSVLHAPERFISSTFVMECCLAIVREQTVRCEIQMKQVLLTFSVVLATSMPLRGVRQYLSFSNYETFSVNEKRF